jgi:hypothetical protein
MDWDQNNDVYFENQYVQPDEEQVRDSQEYIDSNSLT